MTPLLIGILTTLATVSPAAVAAGQSDTVMPGNCRMYASDAGRRDTDIRVMVTDLHNLPGALYGRRMKAKPGWSVILKDIRGEEIILGIRADETDDDRLGTSAAVRLSAWLSGESGPLWTKKEPGHLAAPGSPEALFLSRRGDRWQAAVAAGKRLNFDRIELPAGFNIDSIGVSAGQEGKVIVREVSSSCRPLPDDLRSEWSGNIEALHHYLARSADPLEGYWHWYDSTIDEDLLRPGGDYRLAIVRKPAEDGVDTLAVGHPYLILYLDGAYIEKANWTAGMIKGELRPTPTGNVFDAVWYDTSMRPMSHAIKGVVESDILLTITFPYQQSRIRLHRTER